MKDLPPGTEVFWGPGVFGRYVIVRRFAPEGENPNDPRQFVIRSLTTGIVHIAEETKLRKV